MYQQSHICGRNYYITGYLLKWYNFRDKFFEVKLFRAILEHIFKKINQLPIKSHYFVCFICLLCPTSIFLKTLPILSITYQLLIKALN